MTLLDILIIGLASFRTAQLFCVDDGPYDVFKIIREDLKSLSVNGSLYRNLYALIQCPYCLGIWFAIIFYLMYMVNFLRFPVHILAIAGVQTLLQTVSGRFETYED